MLWGRGRLVGAGILACFLVLVPVAGSARTADSITGMARQIAGGAQLLLRNNGTTTLLFNRGTVPGGKTLTSASQDGQPCRVSGSQWGCGPMPVPANQAFTIDLRSSQTLAPADGPFTMFVSSDGRTDAGPFAIAWEAPPPPPPPAPKPCECKNIGTRTSGYADFTARGAGRTSFSFRVAWTMNCAGDPGNCAGEIDVLTPRGTDIKLTTPKKAIECKGKCRSGEAITQSRGTFRVAGTSVESLDQDARGGKEFSFRFNKFCIRDGKRVAAGRGFITIVYRPNGLVDLKKSDLNGDLKPDGSKRGK